MLGMPAREKRERKVYMTVYVSPELKHVIDMLRGPINRSAFVEFLLWCGLEVLKHRIGKVLARKTSLAELVQREVEAVIRDVEEGRIGPPDPGVLEELGLGEGPKGQGSGL